MMKLITRRKSIEILLENEQYLDKLICPYCRDILREGVDSWYCFNPYCEFDKVSKEEVANEMVE